MIDISKPKEWHMCQCCRETDNVVNIGFKREGNAMADVISLCPKCRAELRERLMATEIQL